MKRAAQKDAGGRTLTQPQTEGRRVAASLGAGLETAAALSTTGETERALMISFWTMSAGTPAAGMVEVGG